MDDALELSPALQLIEEFIILLSTDGAIVFINQAALSLYNWEYNAVIEKSFPDLLKNNGLPSPLPKEFSFTSNNIFLEDIETNFNTKIQKTILWKLASYKLNKKKDSILLIGKDITEIQKAERKIFELDSIIAQTPGNLYWFNKDNVYLGCNEQSAKILGMTRSETTGQDLRYLMKTLKTFDNTLVDILITQGQEVIRTGKPLLNIEEPPFAGADNKFRYYLASKVPLRNKEGEIYAVIGISTDITDMKEIEVKLRDQKEKALAASKSKSEFIANMSHDLRTPITGILGMVQDMLNIANQTESSLKQEQLGAISSPKNTFLLTNIIETVQRDSQLLLSSTDELLQLCNEILEVVSLESGKSTERLESFNLRELIEHNVELLQPIAQHKKLILSHEISQAVPNYLNGLRIYLDRILLNLISNALNFTESGFVKVKARLSKANNTNHQTGDNVTLQIFVEDSGIGIPKDKLNTIFEHFSRLIPAYEGLHKGAGLGLYTVKRYVKEMKGKIVVDSDVGMGTCFTVMLPFIISDHADRVKKSIRFPKILKPAVDATDIILKIENSSTIKEAAGNILVVEDNALATIAIQLALKSFNCSAEIAENGAQAVEKAQSGNYDLILMDIGLPDFSGVEAAKQIRALADTKKSQTPIVALTGHAGNPEKRQEFLDAGIQDVITKPAQPLALESILQRYVFKTAVEKKSLHEKEQQSLVAGSEPMIVIDYDACVRMCNGDSDFARELLLILDKDLKTTRKKLDKFYVDRDTQSLLAELHRVRGGVCYLKLPQLENALKVFYQAVKAEPQDSQQLKKTYAELQQAMNAFLETRESETLG